MNKIIRYMLLSLVVLLVSCKGNTVINYGTEYTQNQKASFYYSSQDKSDSYLVDNAPQTHTPENSYSEYLLAAQTYKLALYYTESEGHISVLDKETGKYYYSDPLDADYYAYIDYMYIEYARSIVIINAIDDLSNRVELMSSPDSVQKEGMSIQKTDSGIDITYYFDENKIGLTVSFSIDGDSFSVEIDPLKFEEDEFYINSITVLPMFGAISSGQEGYLFIPDGTGSIVCANSNARGTLYDDLYGYEDVLERVAIRSFKEKMLLPVFGIKNGDEGIFAIIESGKEKSGIGASMADELKGFNYVYSVYNPRTLATINLPSKNWISKTVVVPEKNPDFSVPYRSKYYFLSTGKNTYTDMANLYREYLINAGEVPLLEETRYMDGYLDLYGYVKKQKSILGWPVVLDEPLTSFYQVYEIASDFEDIGMNLGIKFSGWVKNAYFNKLPEKAKIARVVGSRKELQNLDMYLNSKGISLFLSVDPVTAYNKGNGFSPFRNAAKTVNNIAYTQYEYPLNMQFRSLELPTARLLSPNFFEEFFGRYISSFKKLDVDKIAFDEIGNRLYSDYGSNPASKYDASQAIRNALRFASEDHEVMVDSAADYTLGYVQHSFLAPVKSSRFRICERDVPFYQIALRGLVNISSEPINLSSEPGKALLKCFETGTIPIFSFIGNEPEAIENTRLNYLYAADYSLWKSQVNETFSTYKEFNDQIRGSKIIKHTMIEEDLYATEYENSITVIVNYSQQAKKIGSVEVDAMGYTITKERIA